VGDDAYGVTIAREIESSGERTVMLGAVYTGLDRLEANGLVASTVGAPTPERGGRAKRYFRVTPAGMKAIRQAKRAFTRRSPSATLPSPPKSQCAFAQRLPPRSRTISSDGERVHAPFNVSPSEVNRPINV
jgi:PadR family transcriptional regulator PadR